MELVLNVQGSEGGTVFIDDLQVTGDHFTYTSLADIPLQLKAVPNKGYRFLGWQGIDQDGESISPVLTTDCTITARFAPIEHSNAKDDHCLFADLLVLALERRRPRDLGPDQPPCAAVDPPRRDPRGDPRQARPPPLKGLRRRRR